MTAPAINNTATPGPAETRLSLVAPRPVDFLTVLKSAGPKLTKTFDGDKVIPYDLAKNFSIDTFKANDIRTLSSTLEFLGAKTLRCVIRGQFIGEERARPLAPQARRGLYPRTNELFEEVPHHWVMFDIDRYTPMINDPIESPEEAIDEFIHDKLPAAFHEASYHWQLSSSAGRTPNMLKCHLWFWLKTPYTGPQLKAWTRANELPIDVAPFRKVQVHYTANPVFINGARNPVPRRSGLRKRTVEEVDLVIPQDVIDRGDEHDHEGGESGIDLTDPTQKPGLIGAFCREYPISRVIEELLPEEFEFSVGSDRRVTWLNSGGGAPEGCFVDDEDWYLGNTHNSDPFDNRLANAWDLVRVFKFGDKDRDLTLDERAMCSVSELPSHRAMLDWVTTLPGVAAASTAATNAIPEISRRPVFRVFDDWLIDGDTRMKPGVWYFGINAERVPYQTWVCSPVHIDAVTFDAQDNNFGRLLRFKNTLQNWRKWAMPMELLRGSGEDLRGELLSMGVELNPSTGARRLMATFLQAKPPERNMRCVLQVGWCGNSFVLPNEVIGPNASEVIFQSGERGHAEHMTAGTLAGWQQGVSMPAIGNPVLMLALSASFAGPLLAKCGAESGGLHFVGDSSTGKTTAIEAACATWGGSSYKRSWRATANGMEGAAAMFNDCLLALDEISECDPREVGAIVYALANGRGKQRASRSGAARGIVSWRCAVLSSGERTIATAMAEGGHRAKAGQAVRLLDIPVMRTHGAWDTLHGAQSAAAFSDAIKQAAAAHHGHAGRRFLEKLSTEERDLGAMLEKIKALPQFCGADFEGQDKRAAGRFALFALAGELATEYGITGWPKGLAIEAAGEGFVAWQSLRGPGNDERRQILERVSDFIERHGDGRFSRVRTMGVALTICGDEEIHEEITVRDRAGWWRDTSEGREYLFTAEGMRQAVRGFDFKQALDTLQASGALPTPGPDGKRAKAQRIDGRTVKVYAINAEKLN